MTVDVWMQHPTLRFLSHDMFASLRRWTGQEVPETEVPISATIDALDRADVSLGLLSAWHAPREGALISNAEVAGWVAEHPDRFAGLAAVDLSRPMAAVRELRRCVRDLGFKGLRVVPGYGRRRRPTAATTRCTPRALNSACRSARRSATPAPYARRRPVGRSPTSTRSLSTSPNWSSWAATSATRGRRR